MVTCVVFCALSTYQQYITRLTYNVQSTRLILQNLVNNPVPDICDLRKIPGKVMLICVGHIHRFQHVFNALQDLTVIVFVVRPVDIAKSVLHNLVRGSFR